MKTLEVIRNNQKIGLYCLSNHEYKWVIDGFSVPAHKWKVKGDLSSFMALDAYEKLTPYSILLGEKQFSGFVVNATETSFNRWTFITIGLEWEWLINLKGKSLNDIQNWPKISFSGLTSDEDGLEAIISKGINNYLITFPLVPKGWLPQKHFNNPVNEIEELALTNLQPAFIWIDLLATMLQTQGWFLQTELLSINEIRKWIIPYSALNLFQWNLKTLGYAVGELSHNGIVTNNQKSGLMRFLGSGAGASLGISYQLPQDAKLKVNIEISIFNPHPINTYQGQWAAKPFVPFGGNQADEYFESWSLNPFESFNKVWEAEYNLSAFTDFQVLIISDDFLSNHLDYNIKVTFDFYEAEIDLVLNGQLPKVSSLDLLKRFLTYFNLTPIPDAVTKTLWLAPQTSENNCLSKATYRPINQELAKPEIAVFSIKDAPTGSFYSFSLPVWNDKSFKFQNPKTDSFPLADYWDLNFGFGLLKIKEVANNQGAILKVKCGDSEIPFLLTEWNETLSESNVSKNSQLLFPSPFVPVE